MTRADLYLEPRQVATTPATASEDELGDMLEASFAAGIHDLDGLVARLNVSRVRPPSGTMWTVEVFQAVLRELGR
ncbi:MAG: hypothetical protein JWL84_2744 [Rhodospirillales bacterium]|jgi:hypothetical protein|nr:hypothetical protein [Rhodospirillales bacterium]